MAISNLKYHADDIISLVKEIEKSDNDTFISETFR